MPRVGSLLLVLSLGLCAACGDEPSASGPEGGGVSGPAGVSAGPVDRNAWWSRATTRPSGKERILAPRELRALLEEGRRRGFDDDAEWWGRRAGWAYERILGLDPEDLEANTGSGRRTLQSIEGFEEIWRRMVETRVPDEGVTDLLDRYGSWVLEGRPIFLNAEEYAVEKARLREAAVYLERVENDPAYASLQVALRHVRTSFHSDYPFVYVQSGPFLVFYASRDLQRDLEAEDEAESARLAERREYHRRRLESWVGVYRELLDDLATRYPRLWAKYRPAPGAVFHQWVFGERSWYLDFWARIHRDEPERPYRSGFLQEASGWAYLVEPEEDAADSRGKLDPTAVLKETAVYLAARQLLRRWARDAKDPTVNHMDRSEAFWFKEGWPSYMAGLFTRKPRIGRALREARGEGWEFPPLLQVVERRSRLDRSRLLAPPDADLDTRPPPDGGYSDLAWLLVRYLDEEERREAFERFLLSQIDGSRHGIDWFEECFKVKGTAGWRTLERAVYARIDSE